MNKQEILWLLRHRDKRELNSAKDISQEIGRAESTVRHILNIGAKDNGHADKYDAGTVERIWMAAAKIAQDEQELISKINLVD